MTTPTLLAAKMTLGDENSQTMTRADIASAPRSQRRYEQHLWRRLAVIAGIAMPLGVSKAAPADTGWSYYGGDAGGRRYSDAAQLTPANVPELRRQWLYR